MRHRLASIVAALALVIGSAAPAAAAEPFGYVLNLGWSAGTTIPRGWQTPTCAGRFSVILYRDTNYRGMHTRVCRNEPTLCHVPMEPYSGNDASQCLGFTTDWMNDHVSSIKVTSIQSNWCLFVYEHADYERGGARYRNIVGSVADLGSFGDRMSSIHAYSSASGTCA